MNDDDLDRLLKGLPREEPSANFLRSIREIPARHPREEARSFIFRPFFATLGLVFSLGLGIAVGTLSDEASVDETATPSDVTNETTTLLDLLSPLDQGTESLDL